MWQKDDVTLYQGDCLELLPAIPDGSVDLILADPPYQTTACHWDSMIPLEPMWAQLKRVIKRNGAIVMTSQSLFTANIQITSPCYRYSLIWEKTKPGGFLNARRMPLQTHEDITVHYFALPTYNPIMEIGKAYTKRAATDGDGGNYGKFEREGTINTNTGERFPKSILTFSNDNKNRIHPTQKPVELMAYLIKTYTNEGDTVLDFCFGSGTTTIAAHRLKRKAIGIEMAEEYFELTKDRLKAEMAQGKLF